MKDHVRESGGVVGDELSAVREGDAGLEAGRELDALIAERVMGYEVRRGEPGDSRLKIVWVERDGFWYWRDQGHEDERGRWNKNEGARPAWTWNAHWSTDMATAWEIVGAVQRQHPGWRFDLLGGDVRMATYFRNRTVEVQEDETAAFGWRASFFGDSDPRTDYGQRHADEWAPTAPLAICRAALACAPLTPRAEVEPSR